MDFLQRMSAATILVAQFVTYKMVWCIAVVFLAAALLAAYSPIAVFFNWEFRELLKEHWLMMAMIYTAIDTATIALVLLKQHLDRRWPHVIYM